MPKASAERQVIPEAGYTLLEVLGVLLLIGLVLTLACPEMFLTAERTRIRYAGELLQVDIKQLYTEAKAGNKAVLRFTASGYDFWIGDTEIKRDYGNDGLTFRLPADNEEETGAELTFAPVGSVSVSEVNLESKHYRGVLKLAPDPGQMEWKYYAK